MPSRQRSRFPAASNKPAHCTPDPARHHASIIAPLMSYPAPIGAARLGWSEARQLGRTDRRAYAQRNPPPDDVGLQRDGTIETVMTYDRQLTDGCELTESRSSRRSLKITRPPRHPRTTSRRRIRARSDQSRFHERPVVSPAPRPQGPASPYLCRDLASSAGSGVVGVELRLAGGACARLVGRVVCARAPSLTSVRDPRVGSGAGDMMFDGVIPLG